MLNAEKLSVPGRFDICGEPIPLGGKIYGQVQSIKRFERGIELSVPGGRSPVMYRINREKVVS